MSQIPELVDAIVVGGGPAGLSGAIVLGRCHRSVLVFDEGRPRNQKSRRVNAYLGLLDVSPAELLALGKTELSRYPSVTFFHESVSSISRDANTFTIKLRTGGEFRSRSLLLAPGIIDRLPRLPGVDEYYGTSIHLCPYCDGWESSDKRIGVMGRGDEAAELALEMLLWSDKVILLTEGHPPSDGLLASLEAGGVLLEHSPVAEFFGINGSLAGVTLENGRKLGCDHVFLTASQIQHDSFLEDFGLDLTSEGKADCGNGVKNEVPGLFVAGNTVKGLQLAMVAAAGGLQAAHGINTYLLELDRSPFP